MKKQVANLCKKLSEAFGHATGKLTGAKLSHDETGYHYLQSDNHHIMAAHGLSVTQRPYNANPAFHSEVNRKAADILYKAYCDPVIVAAMLLQDFVNAAPANENAGTISKYKAAATLFDETVIKRVEEYKRLNEGMSKSAGIAPSPIYARLMKLASNIESLDRHLETTRQFIESANEDIRKTKKSLTPDTEGQLFIKQAHYFRSLEETELYLDMMQTEFDDLNTRKKDMNEAYKLKMDSCRQLIKSWKTENGFDKDSEGPRNLLKEPYMKL